MAKLEIAFTTEDIQIAARRDSYKSDSHIVRCTFEDRELASQVISGLMRNNSFSNNEMSKPIFQNQVIADMYEMRENVDKLMEAHLSGKLDKINAAIDKKIREAERKLETYQKNMELIYKAEEKGKDLSYKLAQYIDKEKTKLELRMEV